MAKDILIGVGLVALFTLSLIGICTLAQMAQRNQSDFMCVYCNHGISFHEDFVMCPDGTRFHADCYLEYLKTNKEG